MNNHRYIILSKLNLITSKKNKVSLYIILYYLYFIIINNLEKNRMIIYLHYNTAQLPRVAAYFVGIFIC